MKVKDALEIINFIDRVSDTWESGGSLVDEDIEKLVCIAMDYKDELLVKNITLKDPKDWTAYTYRKAKEKIEDD